MATFSIVTAAPPTPNGDLHLGHLAGPYSGADIYARACRLRGERSVYATGSDVHQSYVPVKARSMGREPLEMAQGFADEIAAIFSSAEFTTDSYVRPQHSPRHRDNVREFVRVLHENGRLERRTEECLYCETCRRYLFEAHVTGTCDRCGAVSDGNSCENCAWPNVCTDLTDPHCNACGATPSLRSFERLVFPLSRYAPRLAEYHEKTVLSPQLEAVCRDMTEGGLPDIPISHPTDWGIPVPVEGFEDQRVYVWAEMVPGYLTSFAEALDATSAAAGDWRQVWNDPGTDVVQFFGFDNGYFHAVLFPALLMAYDESLRLPTALLTNEFYELEAAKFSTSRRHAIWAVDLLAQVPADVVRFVLALDRPEDRRTNFTWDRFRALADRELAGTWQPWLDALFARLETLGSGRVPDAAGATRSHRRFLTELAGLADRGDRAYRADGFSPRLATRVLCDIVSGARDFSAAQSRLYASRPGSPEAAAALAAEVAAAHVLAQLAHPVMPEFAERLWQALGCQGTPVRRSAELLPAGQRTSAGPTFFTALPADLEVKVMGS
ncbi:methionine--tRNA ligase [Streptomyces sp. NPDC058812]|uniref:methionine--tRNA ligase n=1 Tax=unclassified Streptomyces TaxID=2593676 RepID=UPI0036C3111E